MPFLLTVEASGCVPGTEAYELVIAELKDEAHMLAALHHPNIVAFLGVCVERRSRDPKSLVVELAQDTLQGYLRRRPVPVMPAEFVAFCSDILSGLAYLHTLRPRAAIHRDQPVAHMDVFLGGGAVGLHGLDQHGPATRRHGQRPPPSVPERRSRLGGYRGDRRRHTAA